MFRQQLALLLWKNAILRKRHWIRTIIEILWPLLLFTILIAIRVSQGVETKVECHYPARALPSAGIYPWMTSFICNLQNPCYTSELPTEVPGQINDPPENNNLEFLSELLSLLNSNTFTNITQVANDFQSLTNSVQNLINSSTNATNIAPTDLLNAILTNNQTVLQDLGLDPIQLASLTAQVLSVGQNSQLLATVNQLLPLLQTLGSTSIPTSLNLDPTSLLSNICSYPNVTVAPSIPAESAFIEAGLSAVIGMDVTNSSFCTSLIDFFENDDAISFLWETLKPLMLGKIAYSPNSQLVQSIIARANTTFEHLDMIQQFGRSWETTIGPNVYQSVESLGTTLASTNLTALASALNISATGLEQLSSFLSNNANVNTTQSFNNTFNQLNSLILFVTRILECFELDKFVGFADEAQLVDYSLQLVENRTLWGGIAFQSMDSSTVELPEIVKYKIRQDSAYVVRTTSVQQFFWRPGARAGLNDLKYYTNGFVHMQDMIESAIVELALNETVPSDQMADRTLGKYLAQMPYPCYTRDSYWLPTANAYYMSNDMAYFNGGFLYIQDMIDRAIISLTRGSTGDVSDHGTYLGIYMQEFPYPCYTEDEFLEFLGFMLSLLLTLAWIYSVCIIIKNIVYEKEQRLKEVMKMMGLSNGVHWVAWFIDSLVMMFISILLLLIILWAGAITPFSNMFIVGLWLVCFAIATITMCFLISVFFTRANLAAACGGIIFFLLYIPYNLVYAFDDEMTLTTKLIACLLSNVAFGYGAFYVSQFEMAGDGIQFNNWTTSPDPSDQLTFVVTMIMMLVDAVIYMTLAWYIENVFPGTYGVPRPWYFFATRSYWCGSAARDHSISADSSYIEQDPNLKLEAEPNHLPLGVSINHMRKKYDNGKVAVDDLSINFYEGQITSFLGHNGAGKTTTMSMLTGLFTPTSGSATIYGSDIRSEMDEIRHQLGFCPQHNVLFGDLTVLEHLQFYSGLKSAVGGVPSDAEEVEAMLNDVGLPHKKNVPSRHLSGGMKRKLSVAVAFVGGSKCVILDEPTAGVDPYARRGIWDLLLRFRSNRTIILSTHHMDEADLLGDRIAIISHGRLKCCGSSIFLKSSFGVGYYLTVVKKDRVEEGSDTKSSITNLQKDDSASSKVDEEVIDLKKEDGDDSSKVVEMMDAKKDDVDSTKGSDEGFGSGKLSSNHSTSSFLTSTSNNLFVNDAARSSHITNLVLKTVQKAKIHEENPREVTFILPYAAQAEGRFSSLFDQLDNLHLNYGLTDTSLEEIFLNVAEESRDEGKEKKSKCCFCIPRREKKIAVESTPGIDNQARPGSCRRRNTMTSIQSERRDSMTSLPEEKDAMDLGDGSLGKGSYKIVGSALVWQQFRALLVKRFHHSRRNKKGVIAQVLVPAGFIALALVFSLVLPEVKSLPELELQPWMYGDTNSFYSNDMPTSNLSKEISDALLNTPGLGMRCVDSYSVENYNDEKINCERPPANVTWRPLDGVESLSQNTNSDSTLVCQCTDKDTRVLLAECPLGTGGNSTPRTTLQSSDLVYDMTGRNVSDWLVKTVEEFIQRRYGGLSIGEEFHRGISSEQIASLVEFLEANSNFSFNASTSGNTSLDNIVEGIAKAHNAKVWFDNNGYHSMPTWLNLFNNAALRAALPRGKDPRKHGIVVINHPLSFTSATVDLAALSQSVTDTLLSISVIFALSFIPASFVLFLIDERTSKAKHLQFVSGVNQTIYWVATFLWDMINYMVPTIIVIIIFLCFQTQAYVSKDNLPCFICLLVFYGFAITPMMYPASFYFEVPSTAYVVLTCINLFIGINTSIATFILELLDDPILTEVNKILVQVFLIFPQYCLGRGLIDMALNQAYADAYSSFGQERFTSPFAFDEVGRNLMALVIEGVGFFIITIFIQYRFFVKPHVVKGKELNISFDDDCDEDVLAEKKRLLSGENSDILQVKSLSKIFKKVGQKKSLVAVDRLSFGVPEGECFGLLGVNGAGKTTTFKMLTGDIVPSAGDSTICGQSVLDDIREVQQNTGYCPQFEALNSLLTGREHLVFYSKLRGVPPEDIDRVADWGIKNFGLKMYSNKPAGTYSGGNKRKLSAAIAFIGCPPVVFLDEPTAGMDPMSRRFLWGRISEAVRGGRCIVLTSHSMEECEALCSRLAIMVNGQLKCIGSPQHLKIKYGEGYTITIKVGGNAGDLEAVQQLVASSFPTAVLKESHCNMLMYQLALSDVKLKYLFEVLEESKKKKVMEDYSLSQTTLDEVFVSFAKDQTDGVLVEQLPSSGGIGGNPSVLPVYNEGVDLQMYNVDSSTKQLVN